MNVVRSLDELTRAHDSLASILENRVAGFPRGERSDLLLKAVANTLCWVLHHDHNDQIARLLASIDAVCDGLGYEMGRIPESERTPP